MLELYGRLFKRRTPVHRFDVRFDKRRGHSSTIRRAYIYHGSGKNRRNGLPVAFYRYNGGPRKRSSYRFYRNTYGGSADRTNGVRCWTPNVTTDVRNGFVLATGRGISTTDDSENGVGRRGDRRCRFAGRSYTRRYGWRTSREA